MAHLDENGVRLGIALQVPRPGQGPGSGTGSRGGGVQPLLNATAEAATARLSAQHSTLGASRGVLGRENQHPVAAPGSWESGDAWRAGLLKTSAIRGARPPIRRARARASSRRQQTGSEGI